MQRPILKHLEINLNDESATGLRHLVCHIKCFPSSKSTSIKPLEGVGGAWAALLATFLPQVDLND